MSSNANFTNLGWSPTSSWSTISSVAGSMRATTPSSSHTTQTDPSAAARPSGAAQTSMLATTSFDEGSTRETVSSAEFETQALPSPTATSSGTAPTPIVARTSPLAGSILETDPRFALISVLTTQSDPSPAAIPIGSAPTSMVASTWTCSGPVGPVEAVAPVGAVTSRSTAASRSPHAAKTRRPASANAVGRGAPLSIAIRYVLRRRRDGLGPCWAGNRNPGPLSEAYPCPDDRGRGGAGSLQADRRPGRRAAVRCARAARAGDGRHPHRQPRPDRRRPRGRQDDAGPDALDAARPPVPAGAVHARPDAERHHRHLGPEPQDERLRVPAGPAVYAGSPRRRDQPRDPQDAGGPPRGADGE